MLTFGSNLEFFLNKKKGAVLFLLQKLPKLNSGYLKYILETKLVITYD